MLKVLQLIICRSWEMFLFCIKISLSILKLNDVKTVNKIAYILKLLIMRYLT